VARKQKKRKVFGKSALLSRGEIQKKKEGGSLEEASTRDEKPRKKRDGLAKEDKFAVRRKGALGIASEEFGFEGKKKGGSTERRE